nr:Unknown Function [uncultured bacterium]
MTKHSTQFVDIENARVDEQRKVMQEIIDRGHCPFCPENLALYHKQTNELEGDHWFITKNQWPYKNTKFHYLAILKRHAELVSELTNEEGAELIQLLGQLEKKLGVKGGGFAVRFGDTNYSAGTVKHIHAQFIVPDIEKDDFEPVRFKLGKDKAEKQSY